MRRRKEYVFTDMKLTKQEERWANIVAIAVAISTASLYLLTKYLRGEI